MAVLDRPGPSAARSASLTDRYLDAVAHEVPPGRREEVTARVRACIEAGVSRRVAGGVAPEQAEWQALTELGAPTRVAEAEVGPRSLVGPRVYPAYVRVLRALAWVLLPLVAALVAVGSGIAGENPAQVLASTFSAVVGAAIQVAFWVTVVFVVLDRSGAVMPERERAWSPDDLPAPPAARVSLGETAFGIAVQVLLIGVVLWPWQYWPSVDGEPVPVLNQNLRPVTTAVLVAVLLAGIALAAVTYRVGRWTVPLAAVNTVIDALFGGVVVWLVATGRLLDPAFVTALQASPVLDSEGGQNAASALATLIGWVVGVACALDAFDGWHRALRARP